MNNNGVDILPGPVLVFFASDSITPLCRGEKEPLAQYSVLGKREAGKIRVKITLLQALIYGRIGLGVKISFRCQEKFFCLLLFQQ